MFTPVKMAKIAIMGLRKNQQTAVSILHDMEVLQLEPLSKDVSAILKNERDTELTRQVSDELLRVKALMTVLPRIPVTVRKRFDSVDDLLQTTSSIDVDEQVASLEKEKEALLTEIKDTENNLKLVEEFSFFPEDLNILQLSSASSYFGRIPSDFSRISIIDLTLTPLLCRVMAVSYASSLFVKMLILLPHFTP